MPYATRSIFSRPTPTTGSWSWPGAWSGHRSSRPSPTISGGMKKLTAGRSEVRSWPARQRHHDTLANDFEDHLVGANLADHRTLDHRPLHDRQAIDNRHAPSAGNGQDIADLQMRPDPLLAGRGDLAALHLHRFDRLTCRRC